MRNETHLALEHRTVAPATEWLPSFVGWCFLRTQTGDGYLMTEPRPQAVESGDFLVLRPGVTHRLRASQLGDWQTQYFLVQAGLLSGVLSPFERRHLSAADQRVGPAVRYFPAAHAWAERFAQLSVAASRRDDLATRCRLLALAATVLVEELPAVPPQTGQTAQERFDDLMRRLPEAQLQEHSPADLAQLCGCSVRHFSRLFKGRFGRSLVPKQIELRLEKARELLREADDKIIDVALESGFQHVGLFTATFKRRFGVTPSAYRRAKRSRR